MATNDPPYTFVHTESHVRPLARETTGPYKQIFQDHNFTGRLEKIIIEFELAKGVALARDTASGKALVPANSLWGMLIVYKAFGPKKLLWRQTNGLVASVSTTLLPSDFIRVVMRPEEFVEFAVSEAELLAKRYGLQVELVYHGEPAYARKYINKGNVNKNNPPTSSETFP